MNKAVLIYATLNTTNTTTSDFVFHRKQMRYTQILYLFKIKHMYFMLMWRKFN